MSLRFYRVGEWQIRTKPDDNWRWYYDEEHNRIMLDLANGMLFRSRFAHRMLTPDAFSPAGFRVDDAALYFSFEEKCRDFNLFKERKAELVLDTLVVIRYLKPQIPKSWCFVPHGEMWMPIPDGMAYVWLSDTHKQVNLLVVESGENATLCLLAQPCIVITGRATQSGNAIKITNDRLKPQVNIDSFSLERVVQRANLSAIFGTRLQRKIVLSSPIADFFSGVTSPSKS